MKNWSIPIYDALTKYAAANPLIFHMPGHKLGKGMPSEFLESLHLLDVTEIPGTDNLHFPQGAIKEAQELAAKAFGAEYTFFLVNGSTCGIHAMIMTACGPGDRLIVARDCHKSVIGGMMLAGAEPVYICPEFDGRFNISTAVTEDEIERVLKENPDAKGVLITRPNYHGVCADIQRIAHLVHSCGKILMVDEAHGAHFRFNKKLPVCAMDSGADICVQSAHKTLPAFTQSAYLHVKSSKIDIDRLKMNLSLLQTTSPSYILMSSLDIARAIMENAGDKLLEKLLGLVDCFEKSLSGIEGYFLLNKSLLGAFHHDRTRLVINVANTGLTGFEAEKLLRREFNTQVEMSDLCNIVCIATIADSAESFDRLLYGLGEIASKFKQQSKLTDIYIGEPDIPPRKIELKDVSYIKAELVMLERATGRVSLQMVTPYPPGIPVLCPGEVISGDAVEYIRSIRAMGGNVLGLGEKGEIQVAV
ncbi:MAG: aminotransferase class I/II-fold pyridoxal phosphate-dependent enzyme [Clostridia bacterium]|nr:aminotransferase class I/II-fold pyridoxal phosphate-dependent enzyme [Clostridia bacterium]